MFIAPLLWHWLHCSSHTWYQSTFLYASTMFPRYRILFCSDNIGNKFLHSFCPYVTEYVTWEEENQLDATQWFIELVICSTCFGHVYAHHQELVTVLLVWHVGCNSWLLVVGRSGAGQQAMRPEWGMLFDLSRTASLLTTSNQELHATCHTSSIVASSWWWA